MSTDTLSGRTFARADKPARLALALLFCLAVCLSTPARTTSARRQAPAGAGSRDEPVLKLLSAEVARGKKLLDEGDAVGAVKILRGAAERDRDDDDAWHYFGVALARAGQSNEALKALEHALNLRSRVFNFEFIAQRKADGESGAAESAVRRARFAATTAALAESVEAYVALGPEKAELWQEWLATLRLYAKAAADPKFETQPFRLADLITRASILRKPEPMYTERARRGQISGLVRLRALLGADGKVKGVIVIKGLGGGLSESAAEAARAIKFTPATVDGRPVSQFVVLEYNFWVY